MLNPNNNAFNQALSTGTNIKEGISCIQKDPYIVLYADHDNAPLVIAMNNAAEQAKKNLPQKASEFIDLAVGILGVYEQKGKGLGTNFESEGHAMVTDGKADPDAATALHKAAEFGSDPAIHKSIRSQFQQMATSFILRNVDLEQKNNRGETFIQALPAGNGEESRWLAEALLKQSAKGTKTLKTISALADLHEKYPQMVTNVLAKNSSLLNQKGPDTIKKTIPAKIAGWAQLMSNSAAAFKLLEAMINTKGVELNKKSAAGSTIFSLAFKNASKIPTTAREMETSPGFQRIAVMLLDKGAKPQGKEYETICKNLNTGTHDATWFSKLQYEKGKTALPPPMTPPIPLVGKNWVVKPITTTTPTEVAANVNSQQAVLKKSEPFLGSNNIEKIKDKLKGDNWQFETKHQTDLTSKPPMYLNVNNKENGQNFRMYRDKLSTNSHSVGTYIAMLESFKSIYPTALPKIIMPDPALASMLREACNQVFKDKSSQIKFEPPAPAVKESLKRARAPEAEREEQPSPQRMRR